LRGYSTVGQLATRAIAQVKILAAVFNPIAYDGRVQRECEALSEIADVELLCPPGPDVPAGLPFQVTTVGPPLDQGGTYWRHLNFASILITHAARTRPDFIHAHDFFMAAPGVLAARLSRARLIYDAHELIIPGPGQDMSSRARFWYRLESWSVKKAHLVIAANDERSRLMREHYHLASAPLVIRNIPPQPSGQNVYNERFLRAYKEERLCVYQGAISMKRGLGRLLEAMPFLPHTIRMVIVGGGPDALAVAQEVARLGIEERVTVLGAVPRDRLHSILCACDVGLMCYPFVGLNNINCAPNKVFEYAHAGLPIVATSQPPLETLLTRYNVGLCFDQDEEPPSVAEKILSVMQHRSLYRAGLSRLLAENPWSNEANRLRDAASGLAIGRKM
jgi:glycosyltransferase involved in cell wall biosynthesis